jgi:Icc-related predicted phosphoesterase
MKIAIASDLHLEFADIDFHNPGVDVLVLAGDICTLRHMDTDGKLGDRFRAFFKRCTDRFSHVLYVLGNHESYNSRVDKSEARAKDIRGVTFLQNRTVEINGFKFWGATLWTDFNDNPLSKEAARSSMNDYRVIRTKGGEMRLTPQDTVSWHRDSIHLLGEAMPDVVITHHSPSYRSVPDHFKGDVLNPAYASHLDHLVERLSPRLWVHGHIHSSNDYRIGQTRIVSNPRGYQGYESTADGWQLKVVEI